MSYIIQGKRAAHDFKGRGGYSPTCDCGRCDCFGDNTAIVYGYKQIVEHVYYYCQEHLKHHLNRNEYFLRLENKDRKLKNKQNITIDEVAVDKTIKKPKKCYEYKCENTENLTNVSSFDIRCVCKNCATNDDIYVSAGISQANDKFTCPDCNREYKIKFALDENDGKYEYVACNNPYKTIGTCHDMNSYISRNFCTEINSNSKILKPIAIKPKRKNKSRNVEDLTIPENIITDF
jgi:hypothetical protein